TRVIHQRENFIAGKAALSGGGKQNLRRTFLVLENDVDRLVERFEHGTVNLWASLTESCRRGQHCECRRAAHHIIRCQDGPNARIFLLALMKGWGSEMCSHTAGPGEECDDTIGVRHGDRVLIEPEHLAGAVFVARIHLHDDRWYGDLDGGHGDLVLVRD